MARGVHEQDVEDLDELVASTTDLVTARRPEDLLPGHRARPDDVLDQAIELEELDAPDGLR
jgi:hypothetical protein